jgi:hypothetical protein
VPVRRVRRYRGDDRRRVIAEQMLFALVQPARVVGRGELGMVGELLAERVVADEPRIARIAVT